MSSFTSTIARTMARKDGYCKAPFYMGRGSKLGVSNPKDPCRTAGPKKAPKPWRAAHKVTDSKPKLPRSAVAQPRAVVLSKDEQREAHNLRMLERARQSDLVRKGLLRADRIRSLLGTPSNINRHTSKPHLHIAEITRRGGTPPVAPAKPKRRRRAA